MSKYVDVYVLPIAEGNIAAYKKLATAVGKIFMKHGALSYREYVGSDLSPEPGSVTFPHMAMAKTGETIVYAAVEFRSEAHRNKTMKAIFNDPELAAMADDKPLFDVERMAYGGFKILVDL